eukprot:gene10588-7356_t
MRSLRNIKSVSSHAACKIKEKNIKKRRTTRLHAQGIEHRIAYVSYHPPPLLSLHLSLERGTGLTSWHLACTKKKPVKAKHSFDILSYLSVLRAAIRVVRLTLSLSEARTPLSSHPSTPYQFI